MNQNVFMQYEIDLFCSEFEKIKKDFSDIVVIGEDSNSIYSLLKNCLPCSETENAKNFCVVAVLYNAQDKETLIKKTEQAISLKECNKCIIFDNSELPFLNDDISVAEREYTVLTEDSLSISKAKEFIKKVPTVLLIFDEIISPDFGLEKELDFSNNTVSVTDEDNEIKRGYTYIRDFFSAVLFSFSKSKSGNIYNVSTFSSYISEIKKKAHSIFSEKLTLKCDLSAKKEHKYSCLSALKIKSSGLEFTDFDEAMYYICASRLGLDYDYSKTLTQYCGKLDLLRKAEVDILREVDRICKKHNIGYFLTGGTLLGAVRYNKIIPWDDDLDIGMLRSDFEKFRKVCPKELDSSRFTYASFTNEENCHYLFDKIRLKNTYFSTKFSSQFKIQDGVFVDIFVYDKTSPSPKKQKFHINLIKTAIRFLNIKWTGKADRNMNGYLFSLMVKPFIRFISFSTLHKFSEKMLRLYDKKKTDYLVDGTGLNINRGAFKKECLESCIDMSFEGISVPVPERYDEFLTHVYGADYIKEPTVNKRNGTHDFLRLDLGEYILSDAKPNSEQSLDGELF